MKSRARTHNVKIDLARCELESSQVLIPLNPTLMALSRELSRLPWVSLTQHIPLNVHPTAFNLESRIREASGASLPILSIFNSESELFLQSYCFFQSSSERGECARSGKRRSRSIAYLCPRLLSVITIGGLEV
jgi:hypothetical protein